MTEDIVHQDVKVVNLPFPDRIHLRFDKDYFPEIYWQSGDDTKEYIRLDVLATRVANLMVGLEGLAKKADPLHPPELVPASEVSDAMAAVIRSFGGRIEAIRAAAGPLLDALKEAPYLCSRDQRIVQVRIEDAEVLRDAIEGVEAVGDDS